MVGGLWISILVNQSPGRFRRTIRLAALPAGFGIIPAVIGRSDDERFASEEPERLVNKLRLDLRRVPSAP